jgi:hypothetical protein
VSEKPEVVVMSEGTHFWRNNATGLEVYLVRGRLDFGPRVELNQLVIVEV